MKRFPDAVYDTLRGMLDVGDNTRWTIGDFIEEVHVEYLKYVAVEIVGDVPPDQLKKKARALMIKDLADNTNVDASTLRDSHNMVLFFSKEERRAWDDLSYHQMRAFKSYSKPGEDWVELAHWFLKNQGRIPGVRPIRAEIARRREANGKISRWLDGINTLYGNIVEDERATPELIESLSLLPTIIEDAKNYVK